MNSELVGNRPIPIPPQCEGCGDAELALHYYTLCLKWENHKGETPNEWTRKVWLCVACRHELIHNTLFVLSD